MRAPEIAEEIRRLGRGWVSRQDARRIVSALAACSADDLDPVMREIGVLWLLRRVMWRWLGVRRMLVQLLMVDRVHELSLQVRVEIVATLQRGRTGELYEVAICNILLASTGVELRDIRNMINLSHTYRDLPHLVFHDIDNSAIRQQILNHIAANPAPTAEVKVLSDIDDTVFARLHDHRYPAKTRYPGVLAFFSALDRAPQGQGHIGDLTFVTARPSLVVGIVVALTRRSLHRAGVYRVTILTGSVLALRSHRQMAERKLENIRRYHQLFPEYGLVFVGDNGQGDVRVGEALLREFPDAVRGVFIHDVLETELASPSIHHETDDRIDFFDTYIAAAAAAWERGILSADQARGVAHAAMEDLSALTLLTPRVRRDRREELRRDQQALDRLLDTENP